MEDIVVPSVLDHEGVKLGDIIDIRSSMLYVIAFIHKDLFFFLLGLTQCMLKHFLQ